jgi:hypothetical protein
MSTAQSLIDDVRARIVEANADFFGDDVSILRWLNQGYKNFSTKTEWFEKVRSFPVTINQTEYTIPGDAIGIQLIRWLDHYNVVWRDLDEFTRFAGFSDQTSDRPYIYRLHPWDSKFRIFPIPNTTSLTTTVSGAHSNSVTTITVASTTNFPVRGRIAIGNEQIQYFSTDATHFLQCVRGDGFTTATTYAGGETVTQTQMDVHYSYIPPDMTTGGSAIDSRLPAQFDEAIISYATAICFRAKDKYEIASQYTKNYNELVDLAKSDVAQKQRDRLPCIKDVNEFEVY